MKCYIFSLPETVSKYLVVRRAGCRPPPVALTDSILQDCSLVKQTYHPYRKVHIYMDHQYSPNQFLSESPGCSWSQADRSAGFTMRGKRHRYSQYKGTKHSQNFNLLFRQYFLKYCIARRQTTFQSLLLFSLYMSSKNYFFSLKET